MSPTKLKSLLTGAFFAIIIALASSVVAGDLRFFRPYTADTFGGGRRGHDGVYGSVTGIYWSFSAPRGGYIGATDAKGNDERRWVWDLNTSTLRQQTNSARIEMMSPTTTLGTRFEVGNRRGHHGWLVSGYGLPGQGHRIDVTNVSMAIRDEGVFDASAIGRPPDAGFLWGANFGYVKTMTYEVATDAEGNQTLAGPNQTGWLPNPAMPGGWAFYIGPGGSQTGVVDSRTIFQYIPEGSPFYIPRETAEPGVAVIAPLPVAFDEVAINVNSRHRSGELMYTYRPHPFTWGSMEFLAGARYWDFDDKFGFSGANVITGMAGDIYSTADAVIGIPVRAFEGMVINARGENRVFGPQFGIKMHRHNARWTFGAEGRFTAGINAQTVRTQGSILPHRLYTPLGFASDTATNVLANRAGDTSFGHRQNKTYFSPVLEGRLSADWQWTNAVSFFGAVNGMFADNIARGYRITDYVVRSDGTIFGIRGNDRNTHVFVYGVEAGIRINR